MRRERDFGILGRGMRFHHDLKNDQIYYADGQWRDGHGYHVHGASVANAKNAARYYENLLDADGHSLIDNQLVASPQGRDEHGINGWMVRKK